jgi:hypothetical protein
MPRLTPKRLSVTRRPRRPARPPANHPKSRPVSQTTPRIRQGFSSLVGSCETDTCDYRLSKAEGGTDVFEAFAGRKSVRFEVDPEVAAAYEINVRDIEGEGASCTAIITGGGFDDRQQRLTTGDGPTCSVSTSP